MNEIQLISSSAIPERMFNLVMAYNSGCFLRLGDGELRFLIEMRDSKWIDGDYDRARANSCFEATGTLGLDSRFYNRLMNAYQSAEVVDLYLGQAFNNENFATIELFRDESLLTCSSNGDFPIIFDFAHKYFKKILERRRCLFVGAEVGLMEKLLQEDDFLCIAADYFPRNSKHFFYTPPEMGRSPNLHYDRIYRDCSCIIRKEEIDVVFVALGGVAKILSFELSREFKIFALDVGALLRGLTYCGFDGQNGRRSSHNPFFFRVPINLFNRALVSAHPQLSDEALLDRLRAQVCLEIQVKRMLGTAPSDVHDILSVDKKPQNIFNLLISYRFYKRFRFTLRDKIAVIRSDETLSEWLDFHALTSKGIVKKFIKLLKVTILRLFYSELREYLRLKKWR